MNKPIAKIRAKIPAIISPELNKMAVTPSWTPKSLKASSVQLNCGQETIASEISVNAIMGARIPLTPDVLSQTSFFEFIMRTLSLKN